MKHILIILSILLFTSPLFGQSKEKPCYVSVTSSDEFNLILLSNISTSLISQYIREVKPIPSSGISGQNHCIYEVSVTKDEEKTFVTLQGKDLNSFGDSSLEGTDGFHQSILRSIYEGQELKSRQTVLLTVEQKQIIERRRRDSMMSVCFTWFPISGLGKPKLYQNMWFFTRNGDFTWTEFGYCDFCVSWSE